VKEPLYILGTGLSHNGSCVLLKNGEIVFAIEKERLTRIKHDGGNDTDAIRYCLDAEGITLDEVSLVVQCANFEIPKPDYFQGKRLFSEKGNPPVITISHHLAHAYSAVGTSPFDACGVMVIDGCGSPLDQFLQLHPNAAKSISKSILEFPEMQCEKDSFYHFDGQKMQLLWKDFSVMSPYQEHELSLPTTKHSIGGFYAAMSHYVFGNMEDAGKLMGLAPYGTSGAFFGNVFEFNSDGRLMVADDWKAQFDKPSKGKEDFYADFQYYANVARWAQEQVEQAVLKCFEIRLKDFPIKNVCYSGGVALNAVANAKLVRSNLADAWYFEPAAADNGLALGCAFYGWLEYFNKPKKPHDGSTCFGREYSKKAIELALNELPSNTFNCHQYLEDSDLLKETATLLKAGKTVGWFQSGCEFGPRALGRRSILADPRKQGMKSHINARIKFREDFRPFAPSVLEEFAEEFFESGRKSPYMILVDRTKKDYAQPLANVTHVDGTARVQTVTKKWNPRYYALIQEFQHQSGLPVLLNTSFNKKGMPIVETPKEALKLFLETDLDALVLDSNLITKKKTATQSDVLEKILKFLDEIGVEVVSAPLKDPCVLPGLALQGNKIVMDAAKMLYPGDLLHEAGHLAVTSAAERHLIGTDLMDLSWPSDGDEIAAIAWSYAALRALHLPAEVVFHPNGYKDQSEWIINQFNNDNFIGVSLLQWMGLCDARDYPTMIKWLR